jgi:hypothetical protein
MLVGKKIFTQEEKKAFEKVLDMGFTIQNSKEDLMKSNFGEIVIIDADWKEKEYKSISTALTRFIKREEDYANGI